MIYYRNEKIAEEKNFLGDHLTQTASEYISIIIGLKIMRRTFRRLENKMIIINIKSQIAVNQIRKIWRIKNPKMYLLHCIVMSLLEGLKYYIKYKDSSENCETQLLAAEAIE